MTIKDVFSLAWRAALDIWAKEAEYLEKNPDNPFTKERERAAWARLKAIESISKRDYDLDLTELLEKGIGRI